MIAMPSGNKDLELSMDDIGKYEYFPYEFLHKDKSDNYRMLVERSVNPPQFIHDGNDGFYKLSNTGKIFPNSNNYAKYGLPITISKVKFAYYELGDFDEQEETFNVSSLIPDDVLVNECAIFFQTEMTKAYSIKSVEVHSTPTDGRSQGTRRICYTVVDSSDLSKRYKLDEEFVRDNGTIISSDGEVIYSSLDDFSFVGVTEYKVNEEYYYCIPTHSSILLEGNVIEPVSCSDKGLWIVSKILRPMTKQADKTTVKLTEYFGEYPDISFSLSSIERRFRVVRIVKRKIIMDEDDSE